LLNKLLIANRGEIALRIIRSARALGIKTVAVFSATDRDAEHVATADEAYALGGPQPVQGYLDGAAIVAAAQATGADAIHPGYGFLSERADFALAVERAGLIFVGPPPAAMAALGDKLAARALAIRLGVPVVPGIDAADPRSVRAFAAATGYPLLVKAAGGGGGRGMRVVNREEELPEALAAAAREAQAAFGDGRIFVERYLRRARHIEIQIIADRFGAMATLGERECSVQRRHQKVVEESPSPAVDDALRARMSEAALRMAAAAGYQNAGTVEFMVEGREFYFLEVNARLQVEHPVTEMRFGCDLVAEQLRIATGEKLSRFAAPRGWSLECRLTAEDAEHEFRPATGTVSYLHLPAGPGLRVDTFLTPGTRIGSDYDSLLAKIVTFGQDREEARGLMAAALDDCCIAGVEHTGAFLRDVIASAAFRRGDLTTHFIDDHFRRWRPPAHERTAAFIAAALAVAGRVGAPEPPLPPGATPQSPWQRLAQFRLWSAR
jgi:acetyl/propionyl-CoA carboxylase alpha subunit